MLNSVYETLSFPTCPLNPGGAPGRLSLPGLKHILSTYKQADRCKSSFSKNNSSQQVVSSALYPYQPCLFRCQTPIISKRRLLPNCRLTRVVGEPSAPAEDLRCDSPGVREGRYVPVSDMSIPTFAERRFVCLTYLPPCDDLLDTVNCCWWDSRQMVQLI